MSQGKWGIFTGRSEGANCWSIIDWGFSSRVPFQQAACFPRFLNLQNIDIAPSSTLLEDREMYIASVRCQKSLAVASMMIQVLSSENADFQHCFLESIISKGMHRRLARNGWRLSSCGQSSSGKGHENESRPSRSVQGQVFVYCIAGMMMMLAFYVRGRGTWAMLSVSSSGEYMFGNAFSTPILLSSGYIPQQWNYFKNLDGEPSNSNKQISYLLLKFGISSIIKLALRALYRCPTWGTWKSPRDYTPHIGFTRDLKHVSCPPPLFNDNHGSPTCKANAYTLKLCRNKNCEYSLWNAISTGLLLTLVALVLRFSSIAPDASGQWSFWLVKIPSCKTNTVATEIFLACHYLISI